MQILLLFKKLKLGGEKNTEKASKLNAWKPFLLYG